VFAITLENEFLSWTLDCVDGRLRSVSLTNKLSGRTFLLSDAEELALVLSASAERLEEPLARVSDFVPRGDLDSAGVHLVSPSTGLEAIVHYALDGPTRRKWVEVTNPTSHDVLLLDVELDSFRIDAPTSGGGSGQPIFVADEVFAAVEYPSGDNHLDDGSIRLAHFPGHVLSPGETYTSHAALVSVAEPGQALAHFVSYIEARSLRQRHALSIYTPFGINNQWGPCSTLTDEECLHVLGVLEKWRRAGVQFDYFTLDTGWSDPNSDLTRFRPTSFPNGPSEIVRRVEELGMKFGLWFATSWAAESCWDYPPAWEGQDQPTMPYKNGYPARADYVGWLCYACDAYVRTIHDAVLYHIRENNVRFIKFDGGLYGCDNPDHDHLPGKYSTEHMYGNLIAIADAAREAAPDVFVMWYWGLRSPFWALYGDSIFESGLHMEGSGTSSTPALYYRDSVTLAQDQNAQHAKTIPPLVKDSLGVWLAQTRWGNFMAKERWREAMVMDLGRGSLLFPNIWGDVNLLDDEDVAFLAWIGKLAKDNEAALLNRRTILGDPWRNEVYGYSCLDGGRGFLFLNNPSFESRQVDIPLDSPADLVTRFPEVARLACDDGTLSLCLRPFEVLMIEVGGPSTEGLPLRDGTADLGVKLPLDVAAQPGPEIRFVDAPRFEAQGFAQKSYSMRTTIPSLDGPQPILAVAIKLRRGDDEWRYSPCVCDIVQVTARIGEQHVQLVAVPDARQFGNTQHAGCSWVVYKIRLGRNMAHQPIRLDISAWLPPDVEPEVDAWVVKRWWREDARPVPDGYYADAPS
jgi:hypothetical protein